MKFYTVMNGRALVDIDSAEFLDSLGPYEHDEAIRQFHSAWCGYDAVLVARDNNGILENPEVVANV